MTATKLGFKYEPDYYIKKGLPNDGCFGIVNGHLVLGVHHHQLIMAKFITAGWTWEQLMNADQAWGWYGVNRAIPPWSGDNTKPKEFHYDQAEEWPYITIVFSSDAGLQSETAMSQAKQEFQHLYHLPVKVDKNIKAVNSFSENKEYGSGLHGKDYAQKYLANPETYLQEVTPVPPPPTIPPVKEPKPTPENPHWQPYPQGMSEWSEQFQAQSKTAGSPFKFLWAENILEMQKGYGKNGHWQMMAKVVDLLGREPIAYVGGDFMEDNFHPQFSTITVLHHQGKVPSPEELKQLITQHIQQPNATYAKITGNVEAAA